MKTIEKAREYARNGMSLCMDISDEQDIYCEDLIQAYLAGAKSEREELTKWNDPKRPPNNYHTVLLKIKKDDRGDTRCAIGCYKYGRWRGSDVGNYDHIVGWREIHE